MRYLIYAYQSNEGLRDYIITRQKAHMDYKNRITDIGQLNREIEPFRPISNPHVLRQLKDYFRIGLTYASNALEGNSLTETETKIVIEDGLTVGGKPLRDHFEAIGHSETYDVSSI